MAGKAKIFISYKTGVDNNLTGRANDLRRALESKGYNLWMDQSKLVPGKDWNMQIYDEIPQRQILLLLVAPETGNSDWVRREVDLARGAKVSVLPVRISGAFGKIKPVLEKFDMPRTQILDYTESSDEQLKKLIDAIELIVDETRERQKAWLLSILQDEAPKITVSTPVVEKKPFKPTTQQKTTFRYFPEQYAPPHPCKIHIAAGDIPELKDIDVLVNTENNYMQMARMFESNTVSTMLRCYGAYIDKAGRLIEDTVQEELNQYLPYQTTAKYKPISAGTVIATSAGHPKSYLRTKMKARYIFHAATVLVEGSGYRNWRLGAAKDNATLTLSMANSLKKILELDQAKGVISPVGTPRHDEEQKAATSYMPIRSIIFPLFGAGRGGRTTAEVVPPMARGVEEFLLDNTHNAELKLEHIYFSVYYAEDIPIVEEALSKVFERET